VLHGFKGFKDWGMFPPFADRLARAGFTAVRAPENIGHNPWRMTCVARHALQLH
jgi:hypothetical protein